MSSFALSSKGTLTSESSRRVLRNTYFLLALTMVPTALGALLGAATGLGQLLTGSMVGALATFAIAMGFIFAIQANRNSGLGVGLLLAFTGFMGVALSAHLSALLSSREGTDVVVLAALATASITASMAFLSTVVKRNLSNLASFLFVGLVLLIVASLANLFIQSSVMTQVLAYAGAGIFSLFILVDLKAVRDGHETSYVSATLGIYLSIYNLFSSLLRIFD